jgi:hypothetical protein
MAESRQRGFQCARRSPNTQSGRMVPPKPEWCGNLERWVVTEMRPRLLAGWQLSWLRYPCFDHSEAAPWAGSV